MPTRDYQALNRKVEALRDIVLTVAFRNGSFRFRDYGDIRLLLLKDGEVSKLVPDFIRQSHNYTELWACLAEVDPDEDVHERRSAFVNQEFRPLLEYIESRIIGDVNPPHEESVGYALSSLESGDVRSLWAKALERCETDPEGAITAARSLVESTCKHVLDELGVAYKDSDDAPSLYTKVAKELNLAPDQHAEQVFKQTLSGAISIVNGLSGVANKYGDRHGAGSGKRSKPSPRHARLVVNAAGTVTAFLVDTWVERKN